MSNVEENTIENVDDAPETSSPTEAIRKSAEEKEDVSKENAKKKKKTASKTKKVSVSSSKQGSIKSIKGEETSEAPEGSAIIEHEIQYVQISNEGKLESPKEPKETAVDENVEENQESTKISKKKATKVKKSPAVVKTKAASKATPSSQKKAPPKSTKSKVIKTKKSTEEGGNIEQPASSEELDVEEVRFSSTSDPPMVDTLEAIRKSGEEKEDVSKKNVSKKKKTGGKTKKGEGLVSAAKQGTIKSVKGEETSEASVGSAVLEHEVLDVQISNESAEEPKETAFEENVEEKQESTEISKEKATKMKESPAAVKTKAASKTTPPSQKKAPPKSTKPKVIKKKKSPEEGSDIEQKESLTIQEEEEEVVSLHASSEELYVEMAEEVKSSSIPFSTSFSLPQSISEEEHWTFTEDFEITSEDSTELDDLLSEVGPPKIKKLQRKAKDFFAELVRVPDLDSISISESLARELAIKRGEITAEEGEETETEELETEKEKTELESSSQYESSTLTEYSDLDYNFPSEDEEDVIVHPSLKLGDESLFELFQTIDERPIVAFADMNSNLLQKMQEARQLQKDAETFLKALVDCVVEISEYVDPQELLRKNLDKVRLFKEFISLLDEIQSEWKVSDFLNVKCVMYYRRLKFLRNITPDQTNNFPLLMQKYNETMAELNCLLTRQITDTSVVQQHKREYEKNLAERKDKLEQDIEKLGTLMRSIYAERKKKQRKSLESLIERSLKEMAALREEISSVRTELIREQHSEGQFRENLMKIENIGENLHLSDYEQIQDQQTKTITKIEEKTERLAKLHFHFNGCTNIIAHLRENQSMKYEAMQAQVVNLVHAKTEKNNLRVYNHNLKLSRLNLWKQIDELTLKNGLIAKPALLLDYDKTVEDGLKLKTKVNELKSEIERLEKKIRMFEAKAKKII